MSDDRMRLIAELTNKVSDPLRKMQRDVEAFAKSGKDLQGVFRKLGLEQTNNEKSQRRLGKEITPLVRREMDALRETLKKTVPQFGELSNQVAAFGSGAGTAIGTTVALGAAIYETSKSVAEFAGKMRDLRFASRESGFSPAQLKQLQLGAEEFGISAEQMTQSMSGFADAMTRLHQHDAGFLNSIMPAKRYTGELESLAAAGKTSGEELEALFRAMDQIKKATPGVVGQQQAGKFASLFGVGPELARLSSEEFHKLMQDMKQFGPDPFRLQQAMKDAEGLNHELTKTTAIFDGWKVAIEGELVPALRGMLHMFNEAGAKLNPSTAEIPPTSLLGRLLGKNRSSFDERFHFQVPYKKFATGGIVDRPTNALIGEKGPEAVIPLTGGGFDPFVLMQMLIEQLFGDDRTSAARALIGGGRSKLGIMSGINLGGGAGDIIRRGALGHFGQSGGTAMFRPGIGPRARNIDLSSLPEVSNAALAADRARYAEELRRNPALAQRIAQISLGENRNPNANLSVIETIFNRASARHQSLDAVTQIYTGAGSKGYYPSSTFSGGAAGLNNPKLAGMSTENLRKALAGSNVSNYATDNSSQGLAAREKATGRFSLQSEYGGESFFSPGWAGGGVSSRESYSAWRKALADADADRRVIGSGNTKHEVTGSGQLDVKVSAPPGTSVNASSSGIFQKTNVQRNIQMSPAQSGPQQGGSGYDVPFPGY